MNPPRCRLCGSEHWTSQPHRFGPAKVEPARVLPPPIPTLGASLSRPPTRIERLKESMPAVMQPVTEPDGKRNDVTEPTAQEIAAVRSAKVHSTMDKGGRPKLYQTAAERQKAYRQRKRVKAAAT